MSKVFQNDQQVQWLHAENLKRNVVITQEFVFPSDKQNIVRPEIGEPVQAYKIGTLSVQSGFGTKPIWLA